MYGQAMTHEYVERIVIKARNKCQTPDLSGVNLSGVDLNGASLRGADLRRADLSGANLSGALLSGANLRRADLSRANLYGADLYGASLRGADLRRADLSGADLRGASLNGANLHGANLYGANLYGADLHGANLYGASLHGANLHHTDLLLRLDGLPSGQATLVPTWQGWTLTIGCWTGTVQGLRDLITGDDWPGANTDEERDKRRLGLSLLADMCDYHIARHRVIHVLAGLWGGSAERWDGESEGYGSCGVKGCTDCT